MEEDDVTPYPRTPPIRSFDELPATGISLDPDKYVASSRNAPRYDSYDYIEEKNAPRWSDEEQFYQWLVSAKIPRELAQMLYFHAPEVSFMLGPGHIAGVESIIEDNSLESDTRQAGFFELGRGPNGDLIVIALDGERPGEVGFLPLAMSWGDTPEEAQQTFIPVCRSIGEFFETYERSEDHGLPFDYYDAKEKQNG